MAQAAVQSTVQSASAVQPAPAVHITSNPIAVGMNDGSGRFITADGTVLVPFKPSAVDVKSSIAPHPKVFGQFSTADGTVVLAPLSAGPSGVKAQPVELKSSIAP